MKRTLPLLITAIVGFVLIVSNFLPSTVSWGEEVAIWFDVLASIAFVLGGGNLLKVHLKKISDQVPGWGYSAITLAAFAGTMAIGMFKLGSAPAPEHEFYGETFVTLSAEDFPKTFDVDAKPLVNVEADPVPLVVRQQVSVGADSVTVRGWLQKSQIEALSDWGQSLEWKAAVEATAKRMEEDRKTLGQTNYRANHRALTFTGAMSEEVHEALQGYSDDKPWQDAVAELHAKSTQKTTIALALPEGVDTPKIDGIEFGEGKITVTGPMTKKQKAALTEALPSPPSLPMDEEKKAALIKELEQRGTVTPKQKTELSKVVKTIWNSDALWAGITPAADEQKRSLTWAELLAASKKDGPQFETKVVDKEAVSLTDEQKDYLSDLVQSTTPGEIIEAKDHKEELAKLGPWPERMTGALDKFLSDQPTHATVLRNIGVEMLAAGPLSDEQHTYLFGGYKANLKWNKTVYDAFVSTHEVKYPSSGKYDAQGTPFWWIYEYLFKPLTATMFAMLAFYVASAAFRAFRAKNFEAILLLGTAFIILLGRTPAATVTDIIPFYPSALKFDQMSVFIMQVFNTAGNRAIMIGIALGIASTSLKVLLGIDRSYLGGGDD